MQFRFKIRTLLLFLLFVNVPAFAQTVTETVIAKAGWQQRGLEFRLKDYLGHPKMSWPATLLTYPIDLSAEGIRRDQLELVDNASGKQIQMQLSGMEEKNGLLQKAYLHFMAGLKAGDDQVYLLRKRRGPADKLDVSRPSGPGVKTSKSDSLIVLDNRIIKVAIPQSGKVTLPPIAQLGDMAGWYGKGSFSPKLAAEKLTVTEVSVGPIFAVYQLDYRFPAAKSYNATVRLVAGMDFFELEEEMKGFNAADSLAWRIMWDGLKPDFRFCPNRPGNAIDPKSKGFDNFDWEPIAGSGGNVKALKHPLLPYDQQSRPGGRLPFQIVPYDNWLSWWNLPTATFWDPSKNRSIGIFIKDLEKWDDGDYALWGSTQKLSIYFNWNNPQLAWTFPLVKGTRSTGISIYSHQKDIDIVSKTNVPLLYTDYLRRWYGWISLDKVKNWQLDYDHREETKPLFFSSESQKPEQDVIELETVLENKLTNISENSERNNGPTPVGSRDFNEKIVPLWFASYQHIPEEKMRHLRAAYLFMSYVFMDETLMPIRTMLSGHPNFLADIKAVPGMGAALFPHHPGAKAMADHLEKSVALNLRYHVRPDVPAWHATGGRWTENLGTYTWAFLKPTLRATYLLHHHYDGRNRILQPNISLYAGWLLNGLTAPLASADGKRVNPPQGAHAYGLTPSNLMRMLGQELVFYDPLLAEHLLYVTSPDDRGFEYKIGRTDPWGNILQSAWKDNKGTNPHLHSMKHTGYGYTLRTNFGEANETYVHLQQIDDGPNYRWGRAGEGGNGVIYYYANGKRYSHNGIEDVGDGPFGDVERATNFGIKKQGGYRGLGPYRSVGRNELTEPLFDFGHAQFAQINGNAAVHDDYLSRSVLQSGSDYIVIFDHVKDNQTEGRFSWFVGKDEEYPNIIQLMPGAKGVDSGIEASKSSYHNDNGNLLTKGRNYDGKGSFLTLVTHKADVSAERSDFGSIVKTGSGIDYIFRSARKKIYAQDGIVFRGTAGIVQHDLAHQTFRAALFQGNEIGVPGLKVTTSVFEKNGVSLNQAADGFSGKIQIDNATKITFTRTEKTEKPFIFYLNGNKIEQTNTSLIALNLAPGQYDWQWGSNGLIPAPSRIIYTINQKNGVEVAWEKVPGASRYQLEWSADGGPSWQSYGPPVQTTKLALKDLQAGTKMHIRVLAGGSGGWGGPSPDYPVYVTNQVPHAPEGIRVVKNGDGIRITWGEILGVNSYKLYRKLKGPGTEKEVVVYAGPHRFFKDIPKNPQAIYEYRVAAENGNGTSEKSVASDTDPSRLINWYPKPGEIFRRDTRSHENGYDEYNPFIEEALPVLTYPISIGKK